MQRQHRELAGAEDYWLHERTARAGCVAVRGRHLAKESVDFCPNALSAEELT
jgi:hypothetical protein